MKHIKLRLIVLLLALGVLLVACYGAAQGGDLGSDTVSETVEVETSEGQSPSPPLEDTPEEIDLTKLATHIPYMAGTVSNLYFRWQTDPARAKAIAAGDGLEIEGDRVLVWIKLEDSSFAESVIEGINALNGEVTAHYKSWLDAWIPIPNLAKAANLPGIQYIDQPAYPEED